MLKDRCISVTDLRAHTKRCLDGLEAEPKYIFINNKPVAVLMDVSEFEEHFAPRLIELSSNQVNEDLKQKAVRALKTGKKDLLDI